MNIQEKTAKLANKIAVEITPTGGIDKTAIVRISKEINQLVDQVKNNNSEMLEKIITCQIFLLNELFTNLTREYLLTGDSVGMKQALSAQRQSLTAIKALKQLKVPTKIKTSSLLTRSQLVKELGADMSHNTYQKLINSEEYINASE